jgi:DNA-binding FadR family transcriptional regulator
VELAREIVAGRLSPGDVLPPEPELAREFGISKVVVRECIQELAGYGLLRVQHGKRTTVLEQSEWHVLAQPVQEAYRLAGSAGELTSQAYDVRQVLEMNAVAWAAEHGDTTHLEELDTLVETMRSIARDTREVPEFLIKDRAFHDVIGRATGNMVLRAMIRDLHNLLALNWTNSRTTPLLPQPFERVTPLRHAERWRLIFVGPRTSRRSGLTSKLLRDCRSSSTPMTGSKNSGSDLQHRGRGPEDARYWRFAGV